MADVNKVGIYNAVSGMLLLISILLSWVMRMDRHHFIYDMGCCLVILIALTQIPLLKMQNKDYFLIGSILLSAKLILPYLYVRGDDIPRTVPLLLILMMVLLIRQCVIHSKAEYKGGYGCIIAYTSGVCLVAALLYNRAWQMFFDLYLMWQQELSAIMKIICFAGYLIVVGLLTFAIVRGLSYIVRKWLVSVQEYSVKYKEIDRSVILVTILTLCCLLLTELLTYSAYDNDYALPILWIAMCILVLMIQLVYIRLLVKSISLKEEMRLREDDFEELARYNQDLEQNMEDLRAVRHDIKNIFLTMGGFVEQSGNEEMQAFYRETIMPFADQQIRKTDLQTKLALIHDESMKSFLYYKILQGMEQGGNVELQIQAEHISANYGMAQTDLIRILGILIDNAVEEAMTCQGMVTIQMKEEISENVFVVRNTTREQIRKRGIAAGTTDKGRNRGNGLMIVNKIIERYHNVLLNSYFKGDEFVQYLRIEK